METSICGVMVSVFTSGLLIHDYKTCIDCFSVKHTVLRSKINKSLVKSNDGVWGFSHMSTSSVVLSEPAI